jgi:hypothetical protein
MKISYVVRDAAKYQVDPAWSAGSFDVRYYRGLLDKAWAEIAYAFRQKNPAEELSGITPSLCIMIDREASY